MRRLIITCALLLAVAGSTAAQQAAPDQAPSQQAAAPAATSQPVIVEGNIRAVTRIYEFALVDAIDRAGSKLVTWAREQAGPTMALNMASAAPTKVSAVLLPDNSLAFDIHLAEMNVLAYDLTMRMKEFETRQQQSQRPPEKNADRVTATGLVNADPVTPAPSSGRSVSASQQYSDFVRDALLTFIVDQGYLLPIGSGQMLTIQVTPVDVAITNPIDKTQSRKLSLSIKGEDLELFRQKSLTREQLLLRVLDRRY